MIAAGCHCGPSQESVADHVAEQQRFLADELKPRLDAARGLPGPIALVLANARYRRHATVQALAGGLGIGVSA